MLSSDEFSKAKAELIARHRSHHRKNRLSRDTTSPEFHDARDLNQLYTVESTTPSAAMHAAAQNLWGDGYATERMLLRNSTRSLQVGDSASQRAVVSALRRTSSAGAAAALAVERAEARMQLEIAVAARGDLTAMMRGASTSVKTMRQAAMAEQSQPRARSGLVAAAMPIRSSSLPPQKAHHIIEQDRAWAARTSRPRHADDARWSGADDRRARVAASEALASLEATQLKLAEQLEQTQAAVVLGREQCATVRRDQRVVHAALRRLDSASIAPASGRPPVCLVCKGAMWDPNKPPLQRDVASTIEEHLAGCLEKLIQYTVATTRDSLAEAG
eukprot:SAG31_NODE_4124_length_3561_cov_2.532062_2_plen_331_part_00